MRNLFRLALAATLCAPMAQAARLDRSQWTLIDAGTNGLPNAPGGVEQTTAVHGDFNGDGIQDFAIAERTGTPSVLLYLRTPAGWDAFVVEDETLPIEAGGAVHDIDADGDLDIVFGADHQSDEVWWWENPSPAFAPSTPWTRRLIKADGARKHHDQAFGDFDGDGDVEFATWVQFDSTIRIYEIPANPHAVQPWPAYTTIPFVLGEGMFVADVNRDGKDDLLAGAHWFEHTAGTTWVPHPIDATYPDSRVIAADIVPGGPLEVLTASGDFDGPLNYYTQESNGTWAKTTLIANVRHGHSLEVADFDRDGSLDFFAAEMGDPGAGDQATAWIGWGNGLGRFTIEVISVGYANHMSRAADFDGDGDVDILMKPYHHGAPGFRVLLNDTAPLPLNQWVRHLVDGTVPWQPVFLEPADIDGDLRWDIVTGGWWYSNPGSAQAAWTRETIGAPMHNMAVVHDFDSDGDLDVLGTEGQEVSEQFAWARNDGTGSFTILPNSAGTTAATPFLQGAVGAQFEAGGPYQVALSWQQGENGSSAIQMLDVPADPSSGPWPIQDIHPASLGEKISSVDIDGDGDLDIFQGTRWLRNDAGGTWTSFLVHPITHLGDADRHELFDIDLDGDLDAVVGWDHFTGPDTDLVWFEAPNDPTQQWTLHTLATGVGGGWSLDSADIDHDGDIDVVLGEHYNGTRLIIYENVDHGTTWNEIVIDPGGIGIDHHDGAKLIDIDDDGDLDVLSIGWFNDKVWLFENKAIEAGGDSFPPSMPTGFAVTALSDSVVQLRWDQGAEADLAGYDVYRGNAAGFPVHSSTWIASTPSTRSFYLDQNLTERTEYHYVLVARDEAGNDSPPSDELKGVTPADLSAPRIDSLFAENDTTVAVTLNDALDTASAENLASWRLSAAGSANVVLQGALLDANQRTVRLTTAALQPQTTYVLRMDNIANIAARPSAGDDNKSFEYDPDLRAHFRFDDGAAATTASNSAPAGMSALLTGTQWTSDTADGSRHALAFDGEDDRALLGSLDVAGDELTLAIWCKAESFGVADGRLISKATGLTADEHYWMLSTIQQGPDFFVRYRLRAGGTTTTLVGSVPLVAGQWTHIAAEYDGQAMTLYQDGAWIGSAPKAGALATSAGVDAAVGDQPHGSGERPFHGQLDDVRVYSRLLTGAELASLSNQRFGRPYCEALPNSTGQAARISYSGTTSFSADDLRLETAPLPPGEPGIFWYGNAQVLAPFGGGLRCVGGSAHRLFPASVASGAGVLARDLRHANLPIGGAITAGDTWHFQAWFRDRFAQGASFNLSDGLSLTFLP